MFESDKKSALERLKKGLYSREEKFGEARRHEIRRVQHQEVPVSWEGKRETEEAAEADPVTQGATHVSSLEGFTGGPVPQARPAGHRKAYKLLFMAASFFFVIALLVGAYTIFGGKNFVSVQNLEILVDGPVSVGGGEKLSLNVAVTNKNTAEIELVDLIASYPAGTKDPSDPTKDLSRVRLSLGNIAPGATVQKTFESIMFGEEAEAREVTFTVEYRTANSNAIFYKEKAYKLALDSSPVIVSVDALERVLSDQAAPITITVSSNTTSVVKDLLLVLEYPSGFTQTSASPAASYSNNIWRLGDLAPGSKKTVVINGSIRGQDGEARTVHAHVGIQSVSNEREIATNIISKDHTFEIERPFLGIELAFDGKRDGDVSVEPGRSVRGEVIWTNNSSTRITGARIEAKLSGNALDRSSISAMNGYYDSRTDTIVWEAGRTSGLDAIAPGETGRVTFNFSTARAVPGKAVLNPIVTATVTATGARTDESGAAQSVSTGVTRSAKVVSGLSLSSRILRSQGPFQNGGPIPPKVDQETDYTVVWTVTNTSNSINNAQVTATLPPYVSWGGEVSPEGSNITYNPTGGQITWNAGTIPQNADVGTGAKQVYFKVIFRPSLTQVGSTPEVVSPSQVTGTDSFAGTTLRNSAPGLSTRTTTDLYWQEGQGAVVE